MAKLDPKARAKLAAKEFGLPEKARTAEAKVETGNYPMPDPGHAISAERLSRKQRKDGTLTKDEFERINRKADKVVKAKSKDERSACVRQAAISSGATFVGAPASISGLATRGTGAMGVNMISRVLSSFARLLDVLGRGTTVQPVLPADAPKRRSVAGIT